MSDRKTQRHAEAAALVLRNLLCYTRAQRLGKTEIGGTSTAYAEVQAVLAKRNKPDELEEKALVLSHSTAMTFDGSLLAFADDIVLNGLPPDLVRGTLPVVVAVRKGYTQTVCCLRHAGDHQFMWLWAKTEDVRHPIRDLLPPTTKQDNGVVRGIQSHHIEGSLRKEYSSLVLWSQVYDASGLNGRLFMI